MTWNYKIGDGYLDRDGSFQGTGYSGLPGLFRNNPDMVGSKDEGAIPPGKYLIGVAINDPKLGPVVMALTPAPDTDTFGRSGFYIHGDSRTHPGDASHGCIVLGPAIRSLIAHSPDHILEVSP